MPQGRFTLADLDDAPAAPKPQGRFTLADLDDESSGATIRPDAPAGPPAADNRGRALPAAGVDAPTSLSIAGQFPALRTRLLAQDAPPQPAPRMTPGLPPFVSRAPEGPNQPTPGRLSMPPALFRGIEGLERGAPPKTLTQSFGGGVDQTQGMLYSAAEAAGELVGSDRLAAFGHEGRERNATEAAAGGPASTFSGIDSASAFGQWVKETVGNQIPIMAPKVAGAGAGALAGTAVAGPPGAVIGAAIGAFVPSYALGVGEVQGAIKERGGTAPAAAFIGGSAIAALDSALPGKVGSRLVTWLGREVAEDVAARALLKPVRTNFVRQIAADGAKGMATEGLTEALQEAVGEVSVMAGTGASMDPALGERMLEVGAAGALMGAVGAVQARRPSSAEVISDGVGGAAATETADEIRTQATTPPPTPPPAAASTPTPEPVRPVEQPTPERTFSAPPPGASIADRVTAFMSAQPDATAEELQQALGFRTFGAARNAWLAYRERLAPAETAPAAPVDAQPEAAGTTREGAVETPLEHSAPIETGAGITPAQAERLTDLGYDPSGLSLPDAQEILRSGQTTTPPSPSATQSPDAMSIEALRNNERAHDADPDLRRRRAEMIAGAERAKGEKLARPRWAEWPSGLDEGITDAQVRDDFEAISSRAMQRNLDAGESRESFAWRNHQRAMLMVRMPSDANHAADVMSLRRAFLDGRDLSPDEMQRLQSYRAGGAAPVDTTPQTTETHPNGLIETVDPGAGEAARAPGRAPSSGPPVSRPRVRTRNGQPVDPGVTREQQRAAVIDGLVADARAEAPDVDEADLRDEIAFRLDLYDELQGDARANAFNPKALLETIAKIGGIAENDYRGYKGELKRIKEGVYFGRLAGVPGVFRRRKLGDNGAPIQGMPLDIMLQSLQQFPEYQHIEDIDMLVDILDEIRMHGADITDHLPGTDDARRFVVGKSGGAWWSDRWRPPVDEPSDSVDLGDGDTSFDVDDESVAPVAAPAPKAPPAAAAPQPLTVDTLVDTFGSQPDQAAASMAIVEAMGLPVDRIELARGPDPADADADTLAQSKTRLSVLHNLSAENLAFADKMGGIPVPSLGVVKQDGSVEGYGEITLIGRKHLADPAKEPVFDADAYTGRAPQPQYPKVRTSVAQPLIDALRPYAVKFSDTGSSDQTWDYLVNRPNPRAAIKEMARSHAMAAMFAEQVLGKKVEPVMAAEPQHRVWSKFVDAAAFRAANEARNGWDSGATEGVRVVLSDAIDRFLASAEGRRLDSVLRAEARGENMRQWVARSWGDDGVWVDGGDDVHPRVVYDVEDDLRRRGMKRVDRSKTGDRLARSLKGHEAEFATWVDDHIWKMFGPPYLKLDDRNVPYTLGNIVEASVSARIAGKEDTLTYGEGKARAAASERFTDLEKMRAAAADRIQPESVTAQREVAKKALERYRDAVLPHYRYNDTWEALDASMRAIGRWAAGGPRSRTAEKLSQALRREGFTKGYIAEDDLALGVEAGNLLMNAPVPYFEAKPQRAVALSEFAGAVIPKTASAETRAILERAGLPFVEYRKAHNEQQRRAAVVKLRNRLSREGQETLFQRRGGLFDDDADLLDTGEVQPRLPGDVGAVRNEERPTPKLSDIEDEFRLTPQFDKRRAKQNTLFQSVRQLLQAAWHGSPHIFDEFSLHKIGTGEGAQAYGWGLYFSSSKKIAEWYRNGMAQMGFSFGTQKPDGPMGAYEVEKAIIARYGDTELSQAEQEEMGGVERISQLIGDALSDNQQGDIDLAEARDYLARRWQQANERQRPHWKKAEQLLKRAIADGGSMKPLSGRTYKVEIPEDEDFLDNDKPITQQSAKVKDLLKRSGVWKAYNDNLSDYSSPMFSRGSERRGENIYAFLVHREGSEEAASRYLSKIGVAGLRYRGAESGETNYVVFDDKLVQILDFEQSRGQGAKASVRFLDDGKALIRALTDPDVSSPVHEIAHIARRWLLDRNVPAENRRGITDEDIATAEAWAGAKDGKWDTAAEEKFARGFERYLRDGAAPTTPTKLHSVFKAMQGWLTDVYQSVVGSAIDVEITPEMRQVFDRLVTRKERNAAEDAKASARATSPMEAAAVKRHGPRRTDEQLAPMRDAGKTYAEAQRAHRAGEITSAQFIEARKAYDAAMADDDARAATELKDAKKAQTASRPLPRDGVATAFTIAHKPTGRRFHGERKRAWGRDYYSFDGQTWHKSRLAAFQQAERDGRLWEVGQRRQAPASDTLDTGEQQTRLPGDTGAVRDEERAQPTEDVPEQTLRLTGQDAYDQPGLGLDPIARVEQKAKQRLKDRGQTDVLFQAQQRTLGVDDRDDMLVVAAAKVTRGLDRADFDTAMTREFGAGLPLADLFREGQQRARVFSDLDIDDYFNFKRISVSDAEKAELRGQITETVLRTGRVPKERESWDTIRQQAAAMHPDAVAQLAPFQAMQAPFRAVRDAARRRINVLNLELIEARRALEGVPEEEAFAREQVIAQKEKDLQGLLDTWMRMRSEDGRNLAMHRMTVDSLETWYDATFWMSKAKRELGLPSGTDLPVDVFRALQDILNRGKHAVETGADPEPVQLKLTHFMAGLRRSTRLETLAALRKAGLLTGPKTHMRNVLGNTAFQALEETMRVPAVLVDMALAVATGHRTVHGVSARAIAAASREAATKGLAKAAEIMKTGTTRDDAKRFDGRGELNSGVRWIDAYVNFVFRTMSASDRVFKSYAFRRSLEEQAALEAINRGVSPVELLAKPPAAMLARAIADAEFATFNNPNPAAQALTRAKSALGPGGRFVIDMAVPFSNTPSNIVARMLDYTPVGLGATAGRAAIAAMVTKAMTAEQQRVFSLAIGRGLTGSALLYLGWTLAAAGLATGLGGDDEGDRNVRDAAGMLSGAIKVGDRWHQVATFSPAGNLVSLGASMQRTATKPFREESQRVGKMAAIGTRLVLEQPMLKGLSDVIEALQRPESMGEALAGSFAGSFVPTLVNDLASAFDPYRRDARSEGMRESLWTGAAARLPGLRNTLPSRLTVFGDAQGQDTRAIWDPTIATVARDMSDEVLRELVKHDVGIGWPQKRSGESAEDYRARVVVTGEALRAQLTRLVGSPRYQRQDAAEQVALLEGAISEARDRVRRLPRESDERYRLRVERMRPRFQTVRQTGAAR